MSLDEFNELINNSNILKSSNVAPGDVGASFNVSMMTQVDELEKERHIQMSFVEFIEALFRILRQMSNNTLDSIEKFEEIISLITIQTSEDPNKDQNTESKLHLPEKILYDLCNQADV